MQRDAVTREELPLAYKLPSKVEELISDDVEVILTSGITNFFDYYPNSEFLRRLKTAEGKNFIPVRYFKDKDSIDSVINEIEENQTPSIVELSSEPGKPAPRQLSVAALYKRERLQKKLIFRYNGNGKNYSLEDIKPLAEKGKVAGVYVDGKTPLESFDLLTQVAQMRIDTGQQFKIYFPSHLGIMGLFFGDVMVITEMKEANAANLLARLVNSYRAVAYYARLSSQNTDPDRKFNTLVTDLLMDVLAKIKERKVSSPADLAENSFYRKLVVTRSGVEALKGDDGTLNELYKSLGIFINCLDQLYRATDSPYAPAKRPIRCSD